MTASTRDFDTPGDETMVRPDRAAATISGRARVALRIPERMVLVSVAVVVTLVAILTITPWPVGAFQDDAMYTILARSLAEGHGYRFLNLPGEPNATHFPPGYPLVLALLWKVAPSFPDNVVVFKFANAIFLAIAAIGCFRFVRIRLAAAVPSATVAAVAGTLSVVVLVVTGVVLSEPLFMALLFPALLAAERAAESGRTRDGAVAGAWLGALGLVRTIGAVAIPAALLVLLMRRRWRSALALPLVAAAFLAPWQLWVAAYQHEIPPVLAGKFGSYGSWLVGGYREGGAEFARQVTISNLNDIRIIISHLILPLPQELPRMVMLAIVGLFAVAGMRAFARQAPVTLAFLAAYTIVVVLWPFHPSRFLIAVWPLWLPLVASGVRDLWKAPVGPALRRPARVALSLACLACGAGYLWYNVHGYRREWWVSIQREAGQRAKPIAEWAARHTSPQAVLSTDDDLIVYLYAGRKTLPTATFLPQQRLRLLTDNEDLVHVRDIFRHYRPDYFIVNSRQGTQTAEALARDTPPLLRYGGNLATVRIYSRLQP